MKNTFLIILTVFITGTIFSQTSFLVVNLNKMPVDGAHIFRNQKLIGYTSKEGKFSMPNMPLGDTVFFKMNEFSAIHVVSEDTRKMTQTITLYYSVAIIQQSYEPTYSDIHNDPVAAVEVTSKEEQIYNDTDEPAEFPGGREEIKKYLKKNLRYPESAFQANVQGKCYLRLVVEKNGEILDFKVTRGVPDCPECDEEAKRLVRNFPKFKPAKLNGAVVRSYYVVPVIFKLD